MKKLNEKAFKILKVLVLFSAVFACGLYYVLFVDENLEKEMETTKIETKANIVETTKLVILPRQSVEYVDDEEFIIEVEPILEEVSMSANAIFLQNDVRSVEMESIESSDKEDEACDETTVVEAVEDSDGKVNINTASDDELQTLKNIGPVVASNIISYRHENGDFEDIEDIKNVKGIGDAKFALIKDFICVK